jgi:hypothetical protein
MHDVTIEHVRCFKSLSSLDTVSVTITVPVPTHPLMSVPSVHQRSMAMATSVEESTLDLLQRYTLTAIVAWMREVPITTNHAAFAICIF